jgi:cyclopentanol dehydrogenase
MRLAGKVALISGGARGMGAVEGRLFAREGARVVLGDVRDEEGRRVAAEIGRGGGDAFYAHLDVTRTADWEAAVELAVRRYGRLDVLVNNAGISIMRPIMETDEELWDRTMSINAKGVFLGTKAVIPAMRATGGGSIVNIASLAALVGVATGGSAYPASKGAVRAFTRTTALQHARDGIRCNVVFPGFTVTEMTAESRADPLLSKTILDETPLGRFGRPEDIAFCVLYLASDESSFATGAEFVIDGGRSAH